jgi:hypothetical protein
MLNLSFQKTEADSTRPETVAGGMRTARDIYDCVAICFEMAELLDAPAKPGMQI